MIAVVVAPHPDDEILGCGGLLRHAAEQGMEVRVVAVTDGEACYPDEHWWTPERLRSARRAELAAALGELGIRPDPLSPRHRRRRGQCA
jgi:LmbE family N-acetylglucosaminyl deacetylase